MSKQSSSKGYVIHGLMGGHLVSQEKDRSRHVHGHMGNGKGERAYMLSSTLKEKALGNEKKYSQSTVCPVYPLKVAMVAEIG